MEYMNIFLGGQTVEKLISTEISASHRKMPPKKKVAAISYLLSDPEKSVIRQAAYLGRRGYTIPKSALSTDELAHLREELFVRAAPGIQADEVVAFPVYRENANKFYVPRFYGIERYGLPEKSEIPEGSDIELRFTGSLRDYQTHIIGVYLGHVGSASVGGGTSTEGGGGILEVPCGRGKCLGKDTPILMYDGQIKLVQEIAVGDLLMGDDSTPRKVLTLARGRETMYKIRDLDSSNSYIVNESHILSLKLAGESRIEDISVLDYLATANHEQYTGYRIPNTLYPQQYRISVEKLDVDDYYGFEIDGNRRFVLGDYTVTHNTVMALDIVSEIKKKTLILVHKEFLMNQWIERIAEFLPSARVGKIQGPKCEIDGNDIVIGMIQTMFSREFADKTFDSFGLTIIDEVHRIGSEEFSKTLLKVSTKFMLGISATVDRKDGLTKVLHYFIGPKIYTEEGRKEDAVIVRGLYYSHKDAEFAETEYDFRGNPKYSTMISKLCDFGPRKDFLVRILRDLRAENPEGQIMVLAHNRCLLTYLFEAITHHAIGTTGYYVGGMKEAALKDTESKNIVLATYAMAAEALDIKTLSILLMATPKTDIEQSVGRILRSKHANPIVVDVIDMHDLFQNQWRTRKRFYKKCFYKIVSAKCGEYAGMTATTWKHEHDPSTAPVVKKSMCLIDL
jgi:hypothetical protein